MKNIWTIMHRELVRVFKSPSMILALISPGILIFAMYSFMGANTPEPNDVRAAAANYIVYTVGMPQNVEDALLGSDFNVEIRKVTAEVAAQRIELLQTEDIHMVVIFQNAREFNVFYNPFDFYSNSMHHFVFLPTIHSLSIDTTIAITPSEPAIQVFDMRKVAGGILADLIPMMLLIFLFAGTMTITAESIAGEKERGTMSTLLATPTKRREIAIGKIVSLSIIAMISAISSFLGLMLSLPQLLNVPIFEMYGFGEWALIFLILAATVLFIVGTMSLMSSIAKNVKEATMWISVLMFVGIGVSLLTQVIGISADTILYLIPLYNSVLAMASIISFEIVMINLVVTVISNIVYAGIMVFVLTKLFNSERVMFAK